MDFWTYPVKDSEKGVLNQPMLFMPESKGNLILDYENGRGKAFSHLRKKNFGQYPEFDLEFMGQELTSLGQGSDRNYKDSKTTNTNFNLMLMELEVSHCEPDW